MMSHDVKKAFYLFAGPLMRFNALLFLYFRQKNIIKQSEKIKLHLGPGQKKYMLGWINIDANMFTGKCDLWVDLRNSLPFHDATIDAAYSHHMIEHLPNLTAHFKDVFRCLKPGATYRVGGPNGDSAIKKFIENDKNWFISWPDDRSSIGGRFENFIFCKGEHLTILTYSFLEELMSDVGFINIRKCLPAKETYYPEFYGECLNIEEESDFEFPHTLIIEAEKPVQAI